MATSRRWKVLLFVGVGTTTLATVLWATYLFLGIWLRVRCARDLAAQSETLEVVNIPLEEEASQRQTSAFWLLAGLQGSSRLTEVIGRLEELQRPTVRTIFRHLFGRRETPADEELA